MNITKLVFMREKICYQLMTNYSFHLKKAAVINIILSEMNPSLKVVDLDFHTKSNIINKFIDTNKTFSKRFSECSY